MPGRYQLADIQSEAPPRKGTGAYSLDDIDGAPTPKPPTKATEPTFGSRLYETTVAPIAAVSDTIQSAMRSQSPLGDLVSAGAGAVKSAAKGIYERATKSPQTKAGNPVGGLIDALASPIVEPVYEDVKAGRYGAAAGGVAGNLLTATLPKAAKLLPERVAFGSKAAPVRDAMQFAKERAIPLDAATVSDSTFVRGVQQVAGSTLGGSMPATSGRAAQKAAMGRVAGELMDESHAVPMTTKGAGAALKQSLEQRGSVLAQEAGDAYADLSAIESKSSSYAHVPVASGPGGVVMKRIPLPVDVRPLKDWADPLLHELRQRWRPGDPEAAKVLAQQEHSLQSILDGDDFKPASIAEKDLSALKSLVRNSDPANESTLTGSNAMLQLQEQIDAAVSKAGPDAIQALQKGRARWATKEEIQETAKLLRDEPVQAFQQATYRGDSGIELLKRMNRDAPAEMEKIGRAYLQQMFDVATHEGGFEGGKKMASAWSNLGPETKAILFGKDKTYLSNLDHFFTLAKRMDSPLNTSGTALANAAGRVLDTGTAVLAGNGNLMEALLSQAGSATLSKLMYSPRAVEILTKGLKVPKSGAEKVFNAAQIQALIDREKAKEKQ